MNRSSAGDLGLSPNRRRREAVGGLAVFPAVYVGGVAVYLYIYLYIRNAHEGGTRRGGVTL